MTFVMFSAVVQAGTSLEHGRIYFNGYQTNKKIVSEIYDTDKSDNYKYKMEAIVYVGNKRYSSGWRRTTRINQQIEFGMQMKLRDINMQEDSCVLKGYKKEYNALFL